MKKNYKKWLLVLLLIGAFVLGCSNNSLEQETKKFVVDNNYDVVYSELNTVINEIQMFPTKDSEEKFIYLVQGIKENSSKFNNTQLTNISNLLSFEYNFSFNKINYTTNNYINDQNAIRNYIK